jgi:hypothetical protein
MMSTTEPLMVPSIAMTVHIELLLHGPFCCHDVQTEILLVQYVTMMSTLSFYMDTSCFDVHTELLIVQSVAMMSTTELLHGQFVTKESLLRIIIQDQFLALANSKIIKVDIYVIKKLCAANRKNK